MKFLVMFVAILALGGFARGQGRAAPPAPATPSTEDSDRVIMKWDEFKKVTEWDKVAQREEDKNKFVIPWSEVQDLFNIQIQGVNTANLNLPWKEFKTLLEWSVREAERKRLEKEKIAPPPVPFLIASAQYASTEIMKDGALFKATFKIEILEEKGWKKIEILPGDVAIQEAKLPEGVHLQLDKSKIVLLTKAAGTVDVEIDFAVSVTESGGLNHLTFMKVPSGTCVLDVTIPEKDVDVSVYSAQSKLVRQVEGGTRVVAAMPSSAQVTVSWERAIPEAEKVPPRIYCETRTLLSVADGLFLGQNHMAFSILHTPTRQIVLNVPEGASVLEVTGMDIRDWRVGAGNLTIQFAKEVIGPLSIQVKYEKPIGSMTERAEAPVITALGVEREKGHIAVVALTNVEIGSDLTEGAHLVDVKSLPTEIMGMTNQPVLLAYRYVMPDFKVALDISKHEDVDVLLTVIDRAHFTVMQTFDGRRIIKAIYNVRNNRNQFLRLAMPEGSEIWSATVAGKSTQPARDSEGRVLLPLVRSSGQGGLSSFPVEIVYVEEGTAPDAKGRGTARVELPTCSEPITHLMVALYVPEEGKYSEFEGTLRKVERFQSLGGGPAAPEDSARAAQDLQQAFVARNEVQVKASGASPIKVQLPISGEVHLLEKILVVKDAQWFSYEFSGLKK